MFLLLQQELQLGTISTLIQSDLEHLQVYFTDLEKNHLNWIRHPFAPSVVSILDLKSVEKLIEMTNSGFKMKCKAFSLHSYCLHGKKDNPTMTDREM